MRKTDLIHYDKKVKRVMLYQSEEGVYVFLFDPEHGCYHDMIRPVTINPQI